jgi:hypothetical protein
MNNTFNIKRFALLLNRQWIEFGKIYLISLGVIFGILLCFYGVAYSEIIEYLNNTTPYISARLSFREPLFIVTGFLFITIIASSYFAHLGQKPKAIIDLLIPASTFEKFVAGLFFVTFLGVVGYILMYYLTDLAFVSKFKSMVPSLSAPKVDELGDGVNGSQWNYIFDKYNPNEFKAVYFVPTFVASIFLLGSIYFNKFHYIKTAISVMVFSGIWAYITFKAGEWLLSGKVIESDNNDLNNKSTAELYVSLLLIVLTLVFWSITYVRLKEKEV